MKKIVYPFEPKSNASILPGQFWGIPLKSNAYACGRVLEVGPKTGRQIVVGLMDWVGAVPPTSEAIAGCKVIEHGGAHIKTIKETGGAILGCRDLKLDSITVPLSLDESPRNGCHLRQGFEIIGLANENQLNELQVFSTWGYRVIYLLAEKFFGNKT